MSLVHQRGELRFDRDQVWIAQRGQIVAGYPRSSKRGEWFPPARMRTEPPAATPMSELIVATVTPPELADYAELCA